MDRQQSKGKALDGIRVKKDPEVQKALNTLPWNMTIGDPRYQQFKDLTNMLTDYYESDVRALMEILHVKHNGKTLSDLVQQGYGEEVLEKTRSMIKQGQDGKLKRVEDASEIVDGIFKRKNPIDN